MAENFVSRIIFQDDFSNTVKKFQSATSDVVDSAQRTGSEVEKASSKIGRLKSALSGIRGKHKTEVQAVGLSAVEKNVASIQSQIERLTNKPAVITAQAKLTRDDIKTARAEAKELQRQLKDLTGWMARKSRVSAVNSKAVLAQRCRSPVVVCLQAVSVLRQPESAVAWHQQPVQCGQAAQSVNNT